MDRVIKQQMINQLLPAELVDIIEKELIKQYKKEFYEKCLIKLPHDVNVVRTIPRILGCLHGMKRALIRSFMLEKQDFCYTLRRIFHMIDKDYDYQEIGTGYSLDGSIWIRYYSNAQQREREFEFESKDKLFHYLYKSIYFEPLKDLSELKLPKNSSQEQIYCFRKTVFRELLYKTADIRIILKCRSYSRMNSIHRVVDRDRLDFGSWYIEYDETNNSIHRTVDRGHKFRTCTLI